MRRLLLLPLLALSAVNLHAVAVLPPAAPLVQTNVIVSVRDQKAMLLQDGCRVATFPVSTSKFGLGDNWNAMTTPTGTLQVAQKIGDHAPSGAVFHNRRYTGEVLKPDAPGRDPVVTRIIWLRGLEAENSHAFKRCIYIHGTPEERTIGRPASFGCIRMKSKDVTELYSHLSIGALVKVTPESLPRVKPLPKGVAVAMADSRMKKVGAEVTKAVESTAEKIVPARQTVRVSRHSRRDRA